MPGPRRDRPFHPYGHDRSALKPEHALDRAEQLIQVGQEGAANLALFNIIFDNQRKRPWSVTFEGIMMKLIELSVKQRKENLIKEAMHKYRALCSHQHDASLEKVTRYLVKEAEAKMEATRKSVEGEGMGDVNAAEDLEEMGMETATTLLLEASGAEQSRERSDRQTVVPWMKFLWEVYRIVLDIVKTHQKLEQCYHEMAENAFKFCIKYNRFSEFRRLCEMLRQHLNSLIKHPRTNSNDVQISNIETTQRFLETRFTQLHTAVELRNWQEAYRTIEDIHMLMSLSRKMPRAQTMSIYYEKLTQVFWVSGNYLYHAHALHKLYTLSVKQNQNLTADDARKMASRLLLAAMSVPPYESQSAVFSDGFVDSGAAGENAAKYAYMAAILGYNSPPQRGSLMQALMHKGVLKACHEQVLSAYITLEKEEEPLQMAEKLKPVLEFLDGDETLRNYHQPLVRVAIFRLLEKLGRVYHVVKLSELEKLASFTTLAQVEKTALEALKTRSLLLKFDHQSDFIRFDTTLFGSREVKQLLSTMVQRFETTAEMWKLDVVQGRRRALNMRLQSSIKSAHQHAEQEYHDNLQRKSIIEQRKEEQEKKTIMVNEFGAAREAKRQAEVARKKREENDRKRIREEQQQRERDRQRREEQESLRKLREKVKTESPGVVFQNEDGNEPLDRTAILTKQRENELRAQRDAERRLAQSVKRLDHLERALREANRSHLDEQLDKDIKDLVSRLDELVDVERKQYEEDLKAKDRLGAVESDVDEFVSELIEVANEHFEKWVHDSRAELEERRLAEERRREAEEEGRKQRELQEEENRRREVEQEAERRRQEAEEAEKRQVQEEKEAREREERAQREAEEAQERAAREAEMRELEEQQRQREREEAQHRAEVALREQREREQRLEQQRRDRAQKTAAPPPPVRPAAAPQRANMGADGLSAQSGPSWKQSLEERKRGAASSTTAAPGQRRPQFFNSALQSQQSAVQNSSAPPAAPKATEAAPAGPTRRRFFNSSLQQQKQQEEPPKPRKEEEV